MKELAFQQRQACALPVQPVQPVQPAGAPLPPPNDVQQPASPEVVMEEGGEEEEEEDGLSYSPAASPAFPASLAHTL